MFLFWKKVKKNANNWTLSAIVTQSFLLVINNKPHLAFHGFPDPTLRHTLREAPPEMTSLTSHSSSVLTVSTWTALTGEMCITNSCHVTGIDLFLCLSGLQLQWRNRPGYSSLVRILLVNTLALYIDFAEKLTGSTRNLLTFCSLNWQIS